MLHIKICCIFLGIVFTTSASALGNPRTLKQALYFNSGSSTILDQKHFEKVYEELAIAITDTQDKSAIQSLLLVGSSTCKADGKKINGLALRRSQVIIDELAERGIEKNILVAIDFGYQEQCKAVVLIFGVDPNLKDTAIAEMKAKAPGSLGFLFVLHP